MQAAGVLRKIPRGATASGTTNKQVASNLPLASSLLEQTRLMKNGMPDIEAQIM